MQLSLFEFKQYCNKHSYARYVYDDINTLHKHSYAVTQSNVYDSIYVMLNPDVICFKGGRALYLF